MYCCQRLSSVHLYEALQHVPCDTFVGMQTWQRFDWQVGGGTRAMASAAEISALQMSSHMLVCSPTRAESPPAPQLTHSQFSSGPTQAHDIAHPARRSVHAPLRSDPSGPCKTASTRRAPQVARAHVPAQSSGPSSEPGSAAPASRIELTSQRSCALSALERPRIHRFRSSSTGSWFQPFTGRCRKPIKGSHARGAWTVRQSIDRIQTHSTGTNNCSGPKMEPKKPEA